MLSRLKLLTIEIEDAKGDIKESLPISLLVEDLSMNPGTEFTSRMGHGRYAGYNEKGVLGLLVGNCSFRAELRSNGINGLHAGISALLQACGAELDSTYTLPTTALSDQRTVTLTVFEDGLKKVTFGAMGNCTLEGTTGERVFLNFEMQGCYAEEAWAVDAPMGSADVGSALPMIFRNGTFTIDTNKKRIGSVNLDFGAQVVQTSDLNAESGVAFFQITEFEPTISIDPEAELVDNEDYYGDWLAMNENAAALGFTDGDVNVDIAIGKLQYQDIATGDRNGIFIHDINAQCNNTSGTAITITASAAGGS